MTVRFTKQNIKKIFTESDSDDIHQTVNEKHKIYRTVIIRSENLTKSETQSGNSGHHTIDLNTGHGETL